MTIYPIPKGGPADQPDAITTGPDGNLWFTIIGSDTGSIGSITPSGAISLGVITFFAATMTVFQPKGITTGPDGMLWIANTGGSTLARMTPSGVLTESYAGADHPEDITTGPDGDLWFTTEPLANGAIGRFAPKPG